MNIQRYQNKNLTFQKISNLDEEILWLANLRSELSKKTYGTAIKGFLAFLGITNKEDLRSITHAHVLAYREYLKEKGRAPATINNRLSAISSLFNHLIEHQIVKVNPTNGVKRFAKEYNKVKSLRLSSDDVRSLFEKPDTSKLSGLRNKLFFSILLYTGCRINEAASLKVKDLFMDQAFWMLEFRTKGGRRKRIPIQPQLANDVLFYLKKSGHENKPDYPLLRAEKKNSQKDKHMSQRTLRYFWYRYTEKLGILGTSPHSARATYATKLLEDGIDIVILQDALDHRQLATTQMYDLRKKHYKDAASLRARY